MSIVIAKVAAEVNRLGEELLALRYKFQNMNANDPRDIYSIQKEIEVKNVQYISMAGFLKRLKEEGDK